MLLGLKVQGGSRYMHHKIKEGDTLEAKWPANESPMANKADYNVLIVGGIRTCFTLTNSEGWEFNEFQLGAHLVIKVNTSADKSAGGAQSERQSKHQ